MDNTAWGENISVLRIRHAADVLAAHMRTVYTPEPHLIMRAGYAVQGLTLDAPEVVPFRLTQNLVDGFGASGVEGVYRKSCEVTLQVSSKDPSACLNLQGQSPTRSCCGSWRSHGVCQNLH